MIYFAITVLIGILLIVSIICLIAKIDGPCDTFYPAILSFLITIFILSWFTVSSDMALNNELEPKELKVYEKENVDLCVHDNRIFNLNAQFDRKFKEGDVVYLKIRPDQYQLGIYWPEHTELVLEK